jgi:hypothetical protein
MISGKTAGARQVSIVQPAGECAQVVHVADAIFPGDDCKDTHIFYFRSPDV